MLNTVVVVSPVPKNIAQYATQQLGEHFGGAFAELDYAKVGNYGFLAAEHSPVGKGSNRSGLFVINMVTTGRGQSKAMAITIFQEATANMEAACCPARILNASKEFQCNGAFRKISMYFNSSKKQMRDLKIGNIVFLSRGLANHVGNGRPLVAFRYINQNLFESLDEPGRILNTEPHRLYRYDCSIVYPELLDAYIPTGELDSLVTVAGFSYMKTLTEFVVLGRELNATEKSAHARALLSSASLSKTRLLPDRLFFM